MSHLSPALYATLAEIVPDLHVHCVDPWCVIGSTAALLLGAEVSVADVDVLTSRTDAGTMMTVWAERREPLTTSADGQLFRSNFARFRFPGRPVEVMGELELHTENGWQTIRPQHLMLAGVNGLAVPIPTSAEQIRLLEAFGRPKDHQRAVQLKLLHGTTR